MLTFPTFLQLLYLGHRVYIRTGRGLSFACARNCAVICVCDPSSFLFFSFLVYMHRYDAVWILHCLSLSPPWCLCKSHATSKQGTSYNEEEDQNDANFRLSLSDLSGPTNSDNGAAGRRISTFDFRLIILTKIKMAPRRKLRTFSKNEELLSFISHKLS